MGFGWSASRELYPVYSLLLPLFFVCAFAWIVAIVTLALRRSQVSPASLYGYSVCLIAVVVVILNVPLLVEGASKASDPGNNGALRYVDFESFETFKASYGHIVKSVSDADLDRTYEKLRVYNTDSVRHEGMRELITGVLMLALSSMLFWFHWQWLRRAAYVQLPPEHAS